MSKPTVSQVADLSRSRLGDDLVTGGEVYTNTILLPFIASSVRELFRVMATVQVPRVMREAYYNLPAHTGFLDPATAGITDMGEPDLVEERDIAATFAATACAITSGVPLLTIGTHGLATGARVAVYGVGGVAGVTGNWAITASSSTQVTLNGAVASGTYTSGGVLTTSNSEFVPLLWSDRVLESEGAADNALGYVAWTEDAYRFPTSSEARQLRLRYWASGPTVTGVSDTVGVDDCLDFLAVRSAGLAARSRGALATATALDAESVGAKQTEADGSGGLLRQLLVTGVRQLQTQRPIRQLPFRPKRSQVPNIY